MSRAFVTGDRALRRKLKNLRSSVQRKVGKAAIRSGASVAAKEVKRQIPSRWKDARKSIGWSFKKNKKTNLFEAKIGVAVGKKRAKLLAQQRKQHSKRKAEGKKGAGIGANTAQWAVVGTPFWHEQPLATTVESAVRGGASKIREAKAKKLRDGIMREAAKG